MLDFIYAGRNRRFISFLIVAFALVAAVVGTKLWFAADAVVPPALEKATVNVMRVADIGFSSNFEAVGTVQAISEAQLQTETGGRITRVNVEIGQKVAAGTVLATLESGAESAQLLQAQGAYEAALAGAAAGNITVGQAESALLAAQNGAVSADRNAYTTVSNSFYTILDKWFADPDAQIPGVRLSSGSTQFLNSERVAFQKILPSWQTNSASLSTNANLATALKDAKTQTTRTIVMVDAFIAALNNTSDKTALGVPVATHIAELNTLRATLNGTVAALDGALSGLSDAEDMYTKAKLGGTNTELSAANAQVKIALGSLRAAQASYEKTIVRTPISGVVNALYLKAGEYANPSAPAAIVANNNGLEISTSVSLDNSQTLKVGTPVTINGREHGMVTAIGGAVDPTTGKVAVKVSVDEGAALENGATVTLSFSQSADEAVADIPTEIVIPLSALKMTGTGPIVFFVNNENKLSGKTVTLGAIKGDSVVVAEGLTREDTIVLDARGLKDGQEVTVATK